MPDLPDVIQWAIPLYALAMLVEIGCGARFGTARYETRDTLTSLTVSVWFLAHAVLFGFVGIWLLDTVQERFGLIDWQWHPVAFALCLVLDDLRKYALHRVQHRVRWFWAAHVTHHSSQHYNLSVALRNPPTVLFTLPFLFRLPLALLGFPIEMILFTAGLDSIYQFFTHTELIRRMPAWFEQVFVSPAHHRVHHATNPRYLDSNYGSMFIVWDRLFGTFVDEDDAEPCRYGLVKNLGSFHPVRVVFHEWVHLVQDVLRPGLRMRDRLGYVFGPPGWSHDGSRETTAMLRTRHARAE